MKSHNVGLGGYQCRVSRGTKATNDCKGSDPSEKMAMTNLLREFKDVFAWSHDDMKGLDPKFYQHKINLATDVKQVQQRCYRMNPNYAARCHEDPSLSADCEAEPSGS